MHPHYLALPLPFAIRSRLASFCYGLPQIDWVEEENFHLMLRNFGLLSDLPIREIQDRLRDLFFHPFPIVLQGIYHSFSKENRGKIWVGIVDNPALLSLKKQIESLLRGLELPTENRTFQPHITLGYYERINIQKLGEYLNVHADYQSESIEIINCVLLRAQHTSKRIYYKPSTIFPPLFQQQEKIRMLILIPNWSGVGEFDRLD